MKIQNYHYCQFIAFIFFLSVSGCHHQEDKGFNSKTSYYNNLDKTIDPEELKVLDDQNIADTGIVILKSIEEIKPPQMNIGLDSVNNLEKDILNSICADTIEFVLSENLKKATNHFNLGILYESEKKFDAAKEQYLKGLELDPNNLLGLLNLANLYFQLGDFEASVELLKQVLKLDKNNQQAIQLLRRMN